MGRADGADLTAAGAALFRLGRLFGRRALPPETGEGRPVEVSRILVCEAVATGAGDGAGEVTVGEVAERLAIDPSTASRLVAEAIRAGYVARGASAVDGRRSALSLTALGEALLIDARRYQREVFERITAGWEPTERAAFARSLVRFVAGVANELADA